MSSESPGKVNDRKPRRLKRLARAGLEEGGEGGDEPGGQAGRE